MTQDQTPQNQLVETLKQIDDASDLIDDVIESVQFDRQPTSAEDILEIKTKMQTPEWLLESQNLIEGTIAGEPINVHLNVDFLLDTKTLIQAVDAHAHHDPQGIAAVVCQLKSRPNGDQLAEIMGAAFKPHSFGLTQRIELLHQIPQSSDLGLIEDMVTLTYDGLVEIDYTQLLNRFLPHPVSLSRQIFTSKMRVNLEFFQDQDPFQKSFFWFDDSNSQALTLSIDTNFSRLRK